MWMRQTQSSFPGRNSYRDFRERPQVLITSQKTFKEINSMTKLIQLQIRVIKNKHESILTENEEIKSE